MPTYELPKIETPKLIKEANQPPRKKGSKVAIVLAIIILSSSFGFFAGAVSGSYFYAKIKDYLFLLDINIPEEAPEEGAPAEYIPPTTQEAAVIKAVKQVSPAVVSVVITKDVPVFEEYFLNPFEEFDPFGSPFLIPQRKQTGTEKREIGWGTGFVVSEDGMILTNKHVVSDESAGYTVYTNDGESYEAKVLARDPVQDIAVIKIEGAKNLKPVALGDSSILETGQSVIAIGNALGEFRNTVSVGVVSGLSRTITASGGGVAETLEDVIQTDAAISKGNSGGPLLNLRGEVIGINTAMSLELGAENIGFAIPINKAKRDIEQVRLTGKIVYPFLGVRYVLVNKTVQGQNNLSVDYGAWVVAGENPGETAVTSGSAADKAGIKENDIILELNGEKITQENSLSKLISNYKPGDKISLKLLANGAEKTMEVVLGERSE